MWDDIDLDEGSISVRRTYVRFKGGFNFGPPKTKSSQRTVYVPPQIIRELKALKKRQAEEKLAFPGQYNANNLVFCSEMGEPINPERVTRTFQADLLTAGLPHIRFHDLRHGYATSLLEKGVDIAKICAVMGHSTISTTADIYATVREKPKREIAAIMADILPA